MACVTSRPEVVEVEPKVGPALDRKLMVGVQVTLALAEPLLQLGQHLVGWWLAQPEIPEVPNHVRLPPAVNAPPLIADEAKNPKTPMVGVVTAG